MDLSKLSDEELRTAYTRSRAATLDLSAMSDDELRAAYTKSQRADAGKDITADNVIRSIAHGVPIIGGLADKIAAGGDAVVGPLVDALGRQFGFGNNASGTSQADTLAQRYAENRAREQTQSNAYATQHPVANTAGELTGGVAGGAAMLPAAPLLSATSIGGGAALGGADAYTRTGSARDALMGVLLGGAAPAAFGAVGKVAGKAVPWATSLASGVSPEAQALARQAGREGGEAGQVFRSNMRNPERETLIEMLDQGIDSIKAAGQREYVAGLAQVGKDLTPLSYEPIFQAVKNGAGSLVHNGFVKDPSALNVVRQMEMLVLDHATMPGQTADALSMDALKQGLGAIMERLPYGSNERRVAGNIYHAVKNIIEQQAPDYAKAMSAYSTMKDQVAKLRAALGNSDRQSADAILGKLMSTLRNDVSSRYGARADALKAVASHAPNMPYAIAGQTQNAILPRGIVARGLAAANMNQGLGSLANVATIPFASPRVIGNLNYGLGVASRYAPNPMPGLSAAQRIILGQYINPNQSNQ